MASGTAASRRRADDSRSLPKVAVIGCGPWGRNLARNFATLGALAVVCDTDRAVAGQVSRDTGVPAAALDEILGDPSVPAVAIAAPAAAHAELGTLALAVGKHVFVEKPLALRSTEADAMCELAERQGRTLMVGHLLQYHPAFRRLRRLVDENQLGRVQYLYSNRLNLGRIRREEDILWSFAPHDISMLLSIVGAEPESVSAVGSAHLDRTVADVTTTHLEFPGGVRAHIFVSWLHPVKEHRLVVVGDRGMAVFDDGRPWDEKLQLFRHRIDWKGERPEAVRSDGESVPVEAAEPLAVECRHFLECARDGSPPLTDGREGSRVVRVLEAATESMMKGSPPPHAEGAEAFVHESSYVDERCEIGPGTKVWHFSHLMTGSRVGRDCTLGQNVMVGPGATIGDRCKVQNNVSIYTGVTLSDGVFCGPGCVFTNVVNPRADIDRRQEFRPTFVGTGATIGANATIVCGHVIGAYAFVAAGAVVTADVPAHALVAGVPARRIGWVSHEGERLGDDLVCPRTGRRYRESPDGHLEEIG